MSLSSHLLSSILLILALYGLYKRFSRSKLPPGPLGYPFVGSVFDVSPTEPWITFTNWKANYGDYFYVNVAGRSMLVLNTHKAASDLLDKRSGIYSDRPRLIVASEIMSRGLIMGFMRTGDVWKRVRRASRDALSQESSLTYRPFQQIESYLLADSLIRTPHLWREHMHRSATSFIMAVVYGTKSLRDSEDKTLKVLHSFMRRSLAAAAGSHLVEYIPWLEYLPRWMAPWKRDAEMWFHKDEKMFSVFYDSVQNRMANGDQRPCVAANFLEHRENYKLSIQESVWLAGTMYAAGSDLTAATMSWWLIAMVAYPDALKKAQEEVDSVVGRACMPTFEDYDRLPYIQAMVKEILRWRPAAPLGVPHRCTEDDYYDGFIIPKGTSLIANIWAMNHDQSVYGADADDFRPERYLNKLGAPAAPIPYTHEEGHVTFGFGRRICVGRHVANHNLFIQIASVVWACNIEAMKDESGRPILPDVKQVESDWVMLPKPFECKITPRSDSVVPIIERAIEMNNYGQV